MAPSSLTHLAKQESIASSMNSLLQNIFLPLMLTRQPAKFPTEVDIFALITIFSPSIYIVFCIIFLPRGRYAAPLLKSISSTFHAIAPLVAIAAAAFLSTDFLLRELMFQQ